MGGPTIDVVVMRVVTRFPTAGEFVAGFGRYCTDTTCFIPTTERKTPGIETGFSIRLSDGTPVLRGLCVVLDSWSASESPFKRAGVNLGIRSITPESREVFEQLQAARDARGSSVPIAIIPGNEKAVAEFAATTAANTAVPPPTPPPPRPEDVKATVEMAPLFAAPTESIVPANPLTDISDAALGDFIDCMLYEDPVPAAAIEAEHTSPVVMVPVATGPSREAIATILGVQPLRLTPVYAPLPRPPAAPEAPPANEAVPLAVDAAPTAPSPAPSFGPAAAGTMRASSQTPPPAARQRETQRTMQIAAHRRWWRGVSRLLARVAQLVRRPPAHAAHAKLESRRGPRHARTALAPINSRPDRAP